MNTNATIGGSAVKGPIGGAEMKLYYFSGNGTKTESVAENAPALTAASGAFEFQVNPQELHNVQGQPASEGEQPKAIFFC